MSQEVTKEELLAKAKKPAKDAMKLHADYRGKMQTMLKCQVRNLGDFAIYYTPGVAEPCRAIQADESRINELTNRGNTVAVVSDCTRVLGLGDIGPKAGYPVMEGKALLFKYLGGVDAVPICLGTKNPDEIIQAVKWLEPSFAGINLEDISSPKCFYILNQLREKATIPVWHDDAQGTSAVVLAGILNALKLTGKTLDKVTIAQLGIGSAGATVIRILIKAGVPAGNIRVVDLVNSESTVLTNDLDLEKLFPYRGEMLSKTNADKTKGGIPEALKGADVMISFTRPGPGIVKPEWVKGMAKDAIVFAMANPIPEIWPWEAKEAGAKIVATGRSDFPNQVNNSLGFPAIFRGVLDVQATTITDEMCLTAARSLAEYAEKRGINEDDIVPRMDEKGAFVEEAVAVGMKAQEQGIAKLKVSADELRRKAETMIASAQGQVDALVKGGFIAEAVTD